MIQPSTTFRVPQQASPCFNFLVDAGSFWCSSSNVSSFQKALSRVCNRVRRTLDSCRLSPFAIAAKSSTKTSVFWRGCLRVHRLCGLVQVAKGTHFAAILTVVSVSKDSSGCVSASSSSW
jgi:hypothetical protein